MKSNFKYKLYILAQIGFVQSIWAGRFLADYEKESVLFKVFVLGDFSKEKLSQLDSAFSIVRNFKNPYDKIYKSKTINPNALHNFYKLLFQDHPKSIQKTLIINLIYYYHHFDYSEYNYFILSLFDLKQLNLKEIIFLMLIITFVSEHSRGASRESEIDCIEIIYRHFLKTQINLDSADIKRDLDKSDYPTWKYYNKNISRHFRRIARRLKYNIFKTYDIDDVNDSIFKNLKKNYSGLQFTSKEFSQREGLLSAIRKFYYPKIPDTELAQHKIDMTKIKKMLANFNKLTSETRYRYRFGLYKDMDVLTTVYAHTYNTSDLFRKLYQAYTIMHLSLVCPIYGPHNAGYLASLIAESICTNNIDFKSYRAHMNKSNSDISFNRAIVHALLYILGEYEFRDYLDIIIKCLDAIFLVDIKKHEIEDNDQKLDIQESGNNHLFIKNIKILAEQARYEQSTNRILIFIENMSESEYYIKMIKILVEKLNDRQEQEEVLNITKSKYIAYTKEETIEKRNETKAEIQIEIEKRNFILTYHQTLILLLSIIYGSIIYTTGSYLYLNTLMLLINITLYLSAESSDSNKLLILFLAMNVILSCWSFALLWVFSTNILLKFIDILLFLILKFLGSRLIYYTNENWLFLTCLTNTIAFLPLLVMASLINKFIFILILFCIWWMDDFIIFKTLIMYLDF